MCYFLCRARVQQSFLISNFFFNRCSGQKGWQTWAFQNELHWGGAGAFEAVREDGCAARIRNRVSGHCRSITEIVITCVIFIFEIMKFTMNLFQFWYTITWYNIWMEKTKNYWQYCVFFKTGKKHRFQKARSIIQPELTLILSVFLNILPIQEAIRQVFVNSIHF